MRTSALFSCIILLLASCVNTQSPQPAYHYQEPDYDKVQLTLTTDTLSFPLDEDTFDNLEGMSIRQLHDSTRFSFFDERSCSINEFDYPSRQLVWRMDLQKRFPPNSIRTAYLHTYDSILILTRDTLYHLDSTAKIHHRIAYNTGKEPTIPDITPIHPPVFRDGNIYLNRYAGINSASRDAIRNWRVLWVADLSGNTYQTMQEMPDLYLQHYYVGKLLQYNHCVNDSGRFVFSFYADTVLYESDLKGQTHAWFAKSRYQQKPVLYSRKDNVTHPSEERHKYLISDSYGGVYFDPYQKRYLRIARSGIPEEDFRAKKTERNYRFIILDRQFRIIGESEFPKEVILKQTFFTPNGKIYARIPARNESELAFIRLEYQTRQSASH